jgi:uncharacterized damage-inducible protein DinB
MDTTPESVRNEVVKLLTGGEAHLSIDEAVTDLPEHAWDRRAEELPHTVYELLWHTERAQRDMLEYCTRDDYDPPEWPAQYWPSGPGPIEDDPTPERLLANHARDLEALLHIAREGDLSSRVPTHESHTLLRSLLIVADHNAYHTGQIVDVRRSLGAWGRDASPS